MEEHHISENSQKEEKKNKHTHKTIIAGFVLAVLGLILVNITLSAIGVILCAIGLVDANKKTGIRKLAIIGLVVAILGSFISVGNRYTGYSMMGENYNGKGFWRGLENREGFCNGNDHDNNQRWGNQLEKAFPPKNKR